MSGRSGDAMGVFGTGWNGESHAPRRRGGQCLLALMLLPTQQGEGVGVVAVAVAVVEAGGLEQSTGTADHGSLARRTGRAVRIRTPLVVVVTTTGREGSPLLRFGRGGNALSIIGSPPLLMIAVLRRRLA